ncbi:MAG: alpha/beta hydrolase, partial [Bryobacteraceae bacterium]|nr:alpha/beta hydrolase [Bryobacteraceae bacterium]
MARLVVWAVSIAVLAVAAAAVWLASGPSGRTLPIPPQGPGMTIALRGGRTLGYRETGDPAGAPVLMIHGTPGSRLLYIASDAELKSWGVRFIQPDRPGFGLSSPADSMEYHDYYRDIEQLLDHLKIERTGVLGWSAGTPWALALGATLGTRVTRVGIVGALMTPDDERLRGQTPLSSLLFIWTAKHWPSAAGRLIEGLAAEWRKDPERFFRSQNLRNSKVDVDVAFRPEVARGLKLSNAETLRYGFEPLVRGELRRIGAPWGIDWKAIRA